MCSATITVTVLILGSEVTIMHKETNFHFRSLLNGTLVRIDPLYAALDDTVMAFSKFLSHADP